MDNPIQNLLTDALKRAIDEGQIPAKHYVSLIQILKKKMAEPGIRSWGNIMDDWAAGDFEVSSGSKFFFGA